MKTVRIKITFTSFNDRLVRILTAYFRENFAGSKLECNIVGESVEVKSDHPELERAIQAAVGRRFDGLKILA